MQRFFNSGRFPLSISSLAVKIAAILLSAGLSAGFTSLERLAIPSAFLEDAHWKRFGSAAIDPNKAYQRILNRYVNLGSDGIARFAYGKVTKADRDNLNNAIADMAGTKVTTAMRQDQLAFWINLYNAKTISLVLDKYPVKSIREVKFHAFSAGPWGKKVLTVEGRALSLNDIEHKIVRPLFRDRRVHYVLNCAALGCPNLGRRAYTGKTIGAAMDKAARTFVNHPRAVSVSSDGKLTVSKIYGWFREDFGGDTAGILTELKKYASPNLARRLANIKNINAFTYDWALNDQHSAGGS